MEAWAFWSLLSAGLVVALCLIWAIHEVAKHTHRKLDNIYDATDGMRSRLEQHANDSEHEAKLARDDRVNNHQESKEQKEIIMRWMREALDFLRGNK